MRKRYGKYDPNVFTRWVDSGRVRKVRNGLYLNDPNYIKSEVDMYSLANRMYAPSYVSLESALSYYSIIPDYSFEVISLSTRKTKEFEFEGVRYRFRKIKPLLFFGYEQVQWRGRSYAIATREKAMIDLAYLEPRFNDADWLIGMRFDRDELCELDWQRAYHYCNAIKSDKVISRISLLLNTYDVI